MQGVVQDNLQGLIVLIATLFTAVGVSVSDLGEWRVLLIFIGGYLPFIVFLVVGQVITGSQEERHKAQGADGDESEGSRTAGALVGEVVGAIKTVASFNAEDAPPEWVSLLEDEWTFLDCDTPDHALMQECWSEPFEAEKRQASILWRLHAEPCGGRKTHKTCIAACAAIDFAHPP